MFNFSLCQQVWRLRNEVSVNERTKTTCKFEQEKKFHIKVNELNELPHQIIENSNDSKDNDRLEASHNA